MSCYCTKYSLSAFHLQLSDGEKSTIGDNARILNNAHQFMTNMWVGLAFVLKRISLLGAVHC